MNNTQYAGKKSQKTLPYTMTNIHRSSWWTNDQVRQKSNHL